MYSDSDFLSGLGSHSTVVVPSYQMDVEICGLSGFLVGRLVKKGLLTVAGSRLGLNGICELTNALRDVLNGFQTSYFDGIGECDLIGTTMTLDNDFAQTQQTGAIITA